MNPNLQPAQEIRRLTQEQAVRVYKVLLEQCGARPAEDAVAGFVHEFTRENPTSEYRFCGALGSGGKFRFPRFTVDCYPEDSNPIRDKMVADGNAALAVVKAEIQALPQ